MPLNWEVDMADGNSDKSNTVALLLCFFVGFLGVHRFYVGKVGTGVLQLVTLGGLGIWALIDMIMIILQKFTDGEGKTLKFN
jgi:TM2 domain-containing membrane protein YozV